VSGFLLLTLIVASFAAAEAIYYLISYFGERRQADLRRRLRQVGVQSESAGALLRASRLARSEQISRMLASNRIFLSLEKLLMQSDVEWTVAALLAYSIVGAFIGLSLGALVRSAAAGVLCLAVGGVVPLLVVMRSRDKRGKEISRQLPEALDMIVRSLRAGHALPTSIKLAAHELPTPIATEFGRAYEETVLGESLEQAVLNTAERVPGNLDLRIFAVALVITKQTGGNLAEMLEKIGTTIRERYKFYGHLRSLTAEGRMSGVILGALPWVVLVAVWLTRRKYLEEFWADPLGKWMAAFGVLQWVVGVVWMKRMTKVEV
jgi:tight adherence protein B